MSDVVSVRAHEVGAKGKHAIHIQSHAVDSDMQTGHGSKLASYIHVL